MGVAMQAEVVLRCEGPFEFPWVVNDEDSTIGPMELQRAIVERHFVTRGGPVEFCSLSDVIVAVDAVDFSLQVRERIEHFGLRNISCVDDSFDGAECEDFSHSFDISEIVVRVTKHTDSHGASFVELCGIVASPRYHVRLCWGPGRARLETGTEQDKGDNMAYETLLADLADGILTVTLNRPDRLNAFNEPMKNDLLEVYDQADADDEVRVVIVTGAGRGFCAGADLSSGTDTFVSPDSSSASPGSRSREAPRDGGGCVTLRTFECRKPVIAAINGPAVGVGITQTLPMDIRLASDQARFGFVFARRGLVPEAASSWFLPRIVGISKAMEWVATGRVFGSDEALAQGLVSEVLAPEELLPRAREIASEIVANTSGVAMALSRQMLWKMLGASHPMEAHRIDSRAIDFMGSSPDVAEGVSSFLEKRPPRFEMKVSSDLPEFFPWWEDPSYSD